MDFVLVNWKIKANFAVANARRHNLMDSSLLNEGLLFFYARRNKKYLNQGSK